MIGDILAERRHAVSAAREVSAARRAWMARAAWAAVAAVWLPAMSIAAVPATLTIEGALISPSGGPATDGDYPLTLRLRGPGDAVLLEEGPETVKVTEGRFAWQVGKSGKTAAMALDAAAWVGGATALKLAIQIGSEPEFAAVPVSSVLTALRAGVAESIQCSGCVSASHLAVNYAGAATKGGPALDLACTNCVSVAELAFDSDLDLAGNSLKAKNANFTGDVAAKTLTAQGISGQTVTAASFIGDGSKLTGLALPAGSCPKGQAVTGIANDGKLICAVLSAALPPDGLDDVSGGALSNEFQDVFAAPAKNVAIPDNTGADAVSTIVVPDVGLVKDLKIQVKLSNTDLAAVSIVLLPPDDKAKGIVLCDPCGEVDAKVLDATYPKPTPPTSGDLGKYIGTSPKGLWTLKVKDAAFCVPQKAGNKDICNLNAGTDGVIVDWSITIDTASSSKVQVKGDLIVQGGISSSNGLLIGNASAKCDAGLYGRLRMGDPDGLEVCNGVEWVAALPRPVYWQGGCTSQGAADWRYLCTNHTDRNTASRYLDVSAANSGSSQDPATGRITIKIAGFYDIFLHNWGVTHHRHFELIVNETVVGEGRNYNAGNTNNSLSFNRRLWLDKGDRVNVRLYADSNINWYGATVKLGQATLARSTWLRIEYVGHQWKQKIVCGDGEIDPGEQCDDGNSKDDDTCSNLCKSNLPAQIAWSEVVTSSQSPTLTMGTIAGIPGKQSVIYKIGICGDSEQTSGPNAFRLSGGGLDFTWEASGQGNNGSTHPIGPTPIKGASRGFVYKDVAYTAQAGAGLDVQWTFHSDWDGYRCTDTDLLGKVFDDQAASSVRAWVLYGYK